MTTFTGMKRKRKLLFKIIFILAVFFSIGIDAYSNFNMHPYSTELSTGKNSAENSFRSDIDSMNEDQIDPSYKFDLTDGTFCQIPFPWNCSIVYTFYFSIWQPPKIF